MSLEEVKELRIASLLPAATDVCVFLGLEDQLVGATHECDLVGVEILTATSVNDSDEQGEIHRAVQASTSSSSSSLYPILLDAWKRANPNLVLTQDLCAVCGPSSNDVACYLISGTDENENGSCGSSSGVKTVSLSPSNLQQVVDTFRSVANACGIPDRGLRLQNDFWSRIHQVESIMMKHHHQKQKVFLLEWLDPPFDGGHWIPDMIKYAGLQEAVPKKKETNKSMVVSWDDIVGDAAKPDIVVIACCGMDLERNKADALKYWKPHLQRLEQAGTRIYAADGNKYFARPGPHLCGGVAILAQCAAESVANDATTLLKELQDLDFSPKRGEAWDCIVPDKKHDDTTTAATTAAASLDSPDIEDVGKYLALHHTACARGEFHYIDPATGYQVFTELAHKDRGKCCGSGCRHCPFSHKNVKDKAGRIQQPAFLVQQPDSNNNMSIKVLFHSGGKDSFLTIRALLRQAQPSTIVLLTTFDATSRIIANQEIHICQVQRQAQHLQLPLVGVPLHGGSGETYLSRIRKGLDCIEKAYNRTIDALVFGDLHLEHIRSWREDQLGGSMDYKREYPLWKVPFEQLMSDLEASKVPCTVSNSTVKEVETGTLFDRDLYTSLVKGGNIDGFGENGEFHSLAQVWEVDRSTALGLL